MTVTLYNAGGITEGWESFVTTVSTSQGTRG